MDDSRTLRNLALLILVALLCYYLAESYFNWPPLRIPLGGFVLELRHIVLAVLFLFIAVRLYFGADHSIDGEGDFHTFDRILPVARPLAPRFY